MLLNMMLTRNSPELQIRLAWYSADFQLGAKPLRNHLVCPISPGNNMIGLSPIRLNIPISNDFNCAPEKYQLNHCDVIITHFT